MLTTGWKVVGDQTYTIAHFDAPHYVLGYLPRDGRVYLADRDVAIISYALSLSVVEYQTLVLRGEMEAANETLNEIPDEQKNKIARFLEGQGYKEEALEVATDAEHRFELSLALNKLDVALSIAREADAEHKWKTVGDAALGAWNIALAEECFSHAKDMGSLLLLYSSTSNADGLRELTGMAEKAAAHNVAFSCLWQLGDVDGCIELLLRTNRVAEAVLFSQTYKPSRTPGVVGKWKQALEKDGKSRVSKMLGVPPGTEGLEADEDMFPEWEEWLRLEREGPNEAVVDVEEDEPEGAEEPEEDVEDGDGEGDEELASPQTETEV